jgi:predicted membrane GTPase involved in stress response
LSTLGASVKSASAGDVSMSPWEDCEVSDSLREAAQPETPNAISNANATVHFLFPISLDFPLAEFKKFGDELLTSELVQKTLKHQILFAL